jgi:hypothetical protein
MKEINNCPGYFVNEKGEIFSCVKKISGVNGRRGSYTIIDESAPIKLTPTIHNTNGYVYINIGKYGKKRLHRIVAETFIENPDNLPEINHIDKDKSNNHINNLEWCDIQKNAEHSLSKTYIIENIATGEQQTIFNLAKFCRENSLSVGTLGETETQQRGRKQHKGWRIVGRI